MHSDIGLLQTRWIADDFTVHTSGVPTRWLTRVLPGTDRIVLWYYWDCDTLRNLWADTCQARWTESKTTATR